MKTKGEIFDETFKQIFGCDFKDTTLTPAIEVVMELSCEQYSDERLKEFKEWYDKLSPADKCTVWPPAGSGSGTGLYNMSDEDIIEKFKRRKV
jgi:hypothetical protein